MKQKNDSTNIVTKDFFKKELNNTIDKLLHGIHREMTFSAEVVTEKLERKLTKHTSLILTTVNPLLKELETRQQDRELAAEQSRRIQKQLDDHEIRIQKVERIQQSP